MTQFNVAITAKKSELFANTAMIGPRKEACICGLNFSMKLIIFPFCQLFIQIDVLSDTNDFVVISASCTVCSKRHSLAQLQSGASDPVTVPQIHSQANAK
jgi:hypothetical protein